MTCTGFEALAGQSDDVLCRQDASTREPASGGPATGCSKQLARGSETTGRSSWLMEPTRLETTPDELEKALEDHETIVTSLVATP